VKVRLAPAHRAAIARHRADAMPAEACGLLVGRRDPDGFTVTATVRARNLAGPQALDRYDLSPEDFLATDTSARDRGEEVLGFYHSHVATGAAMSATDEAHAWPAYLYVIAGVDLDLRAWWRQAGGEPFSELAIES
jgi:proteasome lid subunit RPN8/RPN11